MANVSLDYVTDMAIDVGYRKRMLTEEEAIALGDRFNELRERKGRTAKATKQAFQNQVIKKVLDAVDASI